MVHQGPPTAVAPFTRTINLRSSHATAGKLVNRRSQHAQLRRRFYCVKGIFFSGEGDVDELFVEVAGEVSLECAHGLAFGLSFAGASVEVGAGLGVAAGSVQGDGVDSVVGLSGAAAGGAGGGF